MAFYYLESVGCFLDADSGLTYPALTDNTPDLANPVHLDDIDEDDEWFTTLSAADKAAVEASNR